MPEIDDFLKKRKKKQAHQKIGIFHHSSPHQKPRPHNADLGVI